MRKITLGIPVMNQYKLTQRTLNMFISNARFIDQLIIVDNGSTIHLENVLKIKKEKIGEIKFIRHEKNIGVRPALNEIYKHSTGDIIVNTHNDVEMFEDGWDDLVRTAFEYRSKIGIVGAYGAKGIGADNIYQVPYEMSQLGRMGNVSDARMDQEVHGFRSVRGKFENVAVFDGYFMCIKKELLDITNGYSDILPEHHNYDNLISLQSLKFGFENIVIAIDTNHIGGQTDVKEAWSDGLSGSKSDIHRDAHPPLYEYCKWHKLLPARVLETDASGESALFLDNKLIKIYHG